jgi:hypothetical protein
MEEQRKHRCFLLKTLKAKEESEVTTTIIDSPG